jgi:predicted DNA-binding transcriptional regulator AlpA
MSSLEDRQAAIRGRELWRFGDMKLLGIAESRPTIRRWMDDEVHPFPAPLVLSGNSVAWRASEVRAWLDARPRGLAPQPPRVEAVARKRGAACS